MTLISSRTFKDAYKPWSLPNTAPSDFFDFLEVTCKKKKFTLHAPKAILF
jgi:hypothetical protein